MGNSMSKVREKGQHAKVDFFYERRKIRGQTDDFDRFLNNSCNLGVFFSQKSKIPKNYCFEKVKIEEEKNVFFF